MRHTGTDQDGHKYTIHLLFTAISGKVFRMSQDYVWHGHHDNKCPIELLDGSIEERRAEIERNKPANEQATRLKLLKLASPEAIKAFHAYEAQRAPLYADYRAKDAPLYADYQAQRAPLYADYEAKRAPLLAPVLALHETECGCSEWDAETGLIAFPA